MGSRAGSADVHRLNCGCLTVCGILPDQQSICVPCIGRWIPNQWTTREIPIFPLKIYFFFLLSSLAQLLHSLQSSLKKPLFSKQINKQKKKPFLFTIQILFLYTCIFSLLRLVTLQSELASRP